MNFKDYLTSSEAAAFLGISKQALMIWEKKGKLAPPIRNPMNGWRVYKKSDLEAILANMPSIQFRKPYSAEATKGRPEIFPLAQLRKIGSSLDSEPAQKSVERMAIVLEGIEKDVHAGIIKIRNS